MMNISKPTEGIVPLMTGALPAASMQARSGWWLNSGRGVAFTVAGLFVLAVLFGCLRAGSRRTRAMALWVGSMTGLTASLFLLGPGTIWPIVLVVSSIMTACTVLAGSAVGWLCVPSRTCPGFLSGGLIPRSSASSPTVLRH